MFAITKYRFSFSSLLVLFRKQYKLFRKPLSSCKVKYSKTLDGGRREMAKDGREQELIQLHTSHKIMIQNLLSVQP